MKTPMKKILAALATALGLATSAAAAQPPKATVVWESDFGTTSKKGSDGLTYTLNVQENTVGKDGVLEISRNSVGARITPSSANRSCVSILIKYANLAAIKDKKLVIATARGNQDSSDIGLAGHTAGGLDLNGFYDNSSKRYGIGENSGDGLTETIVTPVEGSGYFLFTHNKAKVGGGTGGYAGETLDALVGNKSTKLKWDNTNPSCFCIGGPRVSHDKYKAWKGLKIEKVAIFYGSEFTAADVANYKWPSECKMEIAVSEDASWSDLVADVEDPSICDLTVNVTGAPTIALDDARKFNSVTFTGTPHFEAAGSYEDGCWLRTLLQAETLTVPAGATFADIEPGFVGAYGVTATAITLRAQNKEVISLNIGGGSNSSGTSPDDYLVTGTDYAGLAPVQGKTWVNLSAKWGSATTTYFPSLVATLDGETAVDRSEISATAAANNTYHWATATDAFLKGYLDDGGSHAQITVDDIPYSSYDLIVYAATDNASNGKFTAPSVNGTAYTCGDDGVAYPGNATWGKAKQSAAAFGVNAMVFKDLKLATLNIVGGASSGGCRGGIAAVQIVCTGDIVEGQDFTATVTDSIAFADIGWDGGVQFEEGPHNTATIAVGEGEGEVAIDFRAGDVALKTLKIVSEARDVRLVAEAPLLNVCAIDVSGCAGKVAYEWPVTSLASGESENVYYAGGTAGESAVQIAHNGGVLNLAGGEWKLQQSHSSTATAVNMTDVAVTYPSSILGIGTATYTVGGNSSVETPKFVMTQGAANRTSVFTLKDDAVVEVTDDAKPVDSNQNTIMFGHWAGDSTFTIQDNAAFTAESAMILVGKTGGDHVINVDGGTIATLGIRASASAGGKNVLNLNGGSLLLGEYGISSYSSSRAIAVYVTEDSLITATADTLPITQPIDVADGKTLTIDAAGATVSLGAIAGEGGIVVVNGCYDIGAARSPADLPAQLTLEPDVAVIATQTSAEYAQGVASAFTGFSEGQTITLNKVDGTVEELLVDENGEASSTPSGEVHIDGIATYADATFTNATSSGAYHVGTLSYKAYDGLKLQYDTAVTTNAAGTGVYLKHHPWIEGFPSSFFKGSELTIAVVGEMSPSNNTMFVHLGSTTGSSAGVLLATGSREDEVVVKVNTGTSLTNITTMTVPHAATARHAYVITKADTETESVFSVYLDKTPWKTVRLAKMSFSGGVQCGSDFGGQLRNAGIVKAVSTNDTALVNVLRVYDRVISKDEIDAYSAAYPYTSESGTSSRTCAGTDENWIEDAEATCWSFKQTDESEAVLTNEPPASSAIVLVGTEDVVTTLSVNLEADAHHDSVMIASPGSFKFAKGGDGMVVSGLTTVGCPVEIEYGSLDVSGAPLSLIDEGAVEFDLSGLDISTYYSYAEIPMTGDTEESDRIAAKGLPSGSSVRTAEFRYNGTQYVVAIAVAQAPFVYDDGAWTWNGETVAKSVVDAHLEYDVEVRAGTLTNAVNRTFVVKGGTLVAASVSDAGVVTVEADGTFDIAGKDGGNVKVTLKGGAFVNNGAGIGDDRKQVGQLAVVEADSTVGGTGNFGLVRNGWNANVLDLGGQTLTKVGPQEFWLCNTTVTNGTIAVEGGQLTVTQQDVVFAKGAHLAIGSAGTLRVNGKALAVGAITADEGATINNSGTLSPFTLTGTATLTGNGTWSTNTLASGAVVDVGTKHDFVFAGAGTVNVTLTQAEYDGELPITLFTPAEGATTAIGYVTYDGKDITSQCTISGNQITAIVKAPPVPSWMEGMGEENVELYNAWATAYGVTDPATAKQAAFLLNVANDDEAIAEAKKGFTLAISFDDEGKPVVECPNEDEYNGTVIIKGKAALTDDEWHAQAEGDQFFQATLELIPANPGASPFIDK